MTDLSIRDLDIAIIGMSCRFPGAKNIDAFWENLKNGIESISFFSDEELQSAGIDAATLKNPNYVKANALLSDIDLFDAGFFDFNPREAETTDPQHRIFLECAWEALESSGYAGKTETNPIGVYAGVGMSFYLLKNLYPNLDSSNLGGLFSLGISNDKDYLPTRLSYKLNLKGPSINIQTACSTSLVAVHLACQSLLNGECDIALAGGVSIMNLSKAGYLYQEGMILSPDGHCRAFDAKAKGTVSGDGVGIVVLKRLEEAIEDGDYIHAIIKGSAVNNDGSLKIGYTAPSIEGQAGVISEAQAIAEITADTISYIEAHGTGTELGDPIEIAALNKVFRATTDKKNFCAIGSVKTNFGHTNSAAGVAGLIKTVLALKHKQLPPSLHFEHANPKIDFANSPFYVNSTLSDWKTNEAVPRRAGVSSFGIGGTNAHVILEEAPAKTPSGESRPWQLLLLSAKTPSALETATRNLASYLGQHSEINLADVAYTLSEARRAFRHRYMLVCQNLEEATTALSTFDATGNTHTEENQAVVFMFSGQGSQYVNMALELYQTEPVFKEQVDLCSEYLKSHLNLDLRQVLYPNEPDSEQLNQTEITQPALFVIEYALAKLWMSWGIYPEAMIGHSIGEYVAACLSGVFSLEDALSLVAARGQMMQSMPSGAMLAISLAEEQVQAFLANGLSLAAVNTPELCVVSGNIEAVEVLEQKLSEQNVEYRRLHTSHAFHSEMMQPILSSFTERAKQVTFASPQIPYISNVTGTWITANQAMDPNYWAKHLRQTVRFADGLQELLKSSKRILLEVGPGRTLMTLARRHPNKAAEQVVLNSLRHPQETQSDLAFLLNTLGKLWLAGGQVNWSGFYKNQQRHCIPLPTYPFERKAYWVNPPQNTQNKHELGKPKLVQEQVSLEKQPDIADWFYVPYWKPSVLLPDNPETLENSWLLFCDSCGVASQLVEKLRSKNQEVITVKIGSTFSKLSEHDYTLNPQQAEDYNSLIKELLTRKKIPQKIVHLWSVTANHANDELTIEILDKAQDLGFYSLLFLAQALGKHNISDEIEISVLSNNMQSVTGGEDALYPEKATVLGPVKVIGQEYPNLSCRHIDISIPSSMDKDKPSLFNKLFFSASSEKIGIDPILIDSLFLELISKNSEQLIAYRGKQRWVQDFEPVRLEKPVDEIQSLKEKGVYLITGGLGGIGMVLAEHLAKTVQAKLILVGRSAFPVKDEWNDWLANHDEDNVISQKIQKVQNLEALGAEVLIASADVANLEQMQTVLQTTEEQFGQINGVIHAAGVIGEKSFFTVVQAGKTDSELQFQPKIRGTLVLKKVLLDKKLDFCVLFSSLSSVLGGLGFIAYSAANLFMDAFVYQQSKTNPVPWISVNWDGWKLEHTKPNTSFGTTLVELAITPEEGINIFRRVLASISLINNQLVISTGELHTRLEQTFKSKSTVQKKSSLHPRPSLSTPYMAPRNELEQKLVDIWQKFFGVEKIGINDDFFELGGDSLLAVQLIAKLRETFQINLPAHSFLNVQTIAGLVQLIEEITSQLPNKETRPTLPSSLVELQTGSPSKTPLFLIHPLGGHVYSYRDLIINLDSKQPVYGIQAQGLDGKADIITKIEEMASKYIEDIRVLQPKGPYLLGGFCFGGLVAFEMAQQLKKQGQEISLLAMIDTLKAGQKPILTRKTRDKVGNNTCKTSIRNLIGQLALAFLPRNLRKLLIAKFLTNAEIIAYFLELGANVPVSLKELRKLKPDEQLRYFLNEHNIKEKHILDESLFDINQIRHFFHIFKVNVETFWDYEPQLYPGKIIFFHATERDAYTAPELGWQNFAAGGFEVIKVPGNHLSMNYSPNVEVIAERLNTEFEKAEHP